MRILFFLSILYLYSCTPSTPKETFEQDKTFPKVQAVEAFKTTDFVPTLESPLTENENQIYAASLLMAWDEIKTMLSPIDNINGSTLALMQASNSYQDVLTTDEYNTDIQVEDNLITARAFFKKALPFEEPLTSYDNRLEFKGETVTAFGFYGGSSFARILYYNNDEDFAMRLLPEDQAHEIVLVKTDFANQATLAACIANLNQASTTFWNNRNDDNSWKYYWNDEDEVLIPKLLFNIEKDYKDIVGSTFTTPQTPFSVTKAYQRTAFLLNEKGAEVESEAEITVEATEAVEEVERPSPKIMHFNKKFLILLKRKDSSNPYFAMLVNDTELMGE